MNRRNDVEVNIDGKKFSLSGYESAEYLQKVAAYLNGKLAEFKSQDYYRMLDADLRNLLMQINIADDYFKAKTQLNDLEQEREGNATELFDLRHELVLAQTKLEAAELDLEILREENLEMQKQMIRLETELGEIKKRS